MISNNEFSINKLPKGVYFIRINGQHTAKFVKE